MPLSRFLWATEPPLMLGVGIAHTICCMGEKRSYQPPITSELNYHQVLEAQTVTKLDNLKSTLRTAYKTVRENNYRSHLTKKRYFDRKAKERIFEAGDIVYLFNLAKKRGQNSKFWCPWTGPCSVVERLSKLNYRVRNSAGRECCACQSPKEFVQPRAWREKTQNQVRKPRSRNQSQKILRNLYPS
jgi:hypothetical protein